MSLLIYSCKPEPKKQTPEVAEGEKLARALCVACHAFPEPELLDKKTWTASVLPKMAQLMSVENSYDPNGEVDSVSRDQSTIAQSLSEIDWKKILAYYQTTAPEKLPARKETLAPIHTGLRYFTTHTLSKTFSNPVTTLVRIDSASQKIFIGDGNSGKVLVTDKSLAITQSYFTGPGATDIHLDQDISALIIGDITPSDLPRGKLEILRKDIEPLTVIGNLRRPVQATYADLNGDGQEDVIICEFGFRQGALSWFENKGKGSYAQHILRGLPGSIRAEVYDFNHDGKPDIAAMMAQGNEGVFIYYNEGSGKFREERVIQFPPVYGSNYFQLYDFNRDGFMDILTTNGDNADYSIIRKPYHGIRIFYNDGKNQFTLKSFLPVYGIQKAIPADFDHDGDIDIASIAFHPDFAQHANESFIYWENSGTTYNRSTFKEFADGRWLTMDVGDMDQDGDKDIILGSALIPVGDVPRTFINRWLSERVSVVVLENTIASRDITATKK